MGNDWAEDHHDVEVVDESGRRLVRRRFSEGIAGMAELHAVIADYLGEDGEASDVVVGIETDRGPWVAALAGAGYQVYPINPMQVARYRERHGGTVALRRRESSPGTKQGDKTPQAPWQTPLNRTSEGLSHGF